jgi:hypothetical protein
VSCTSLMGAQQATMQECTGIQRQAVGVVAE